MTPAERDALAMSPEGIPGLGLDADHADILRPGPAWQREVAARAGEMRKLQARATLAELLAPLTAEERAGIAREVLGG